MILPFSMMDVSASNDTVKEVVSETKGKLLVGDTNAQQKKMFEISEKLNALQSEKDKATTALSKTALEAQMKSLVAEAPVAPQMNKALTDVRSNIDRLAENLPKINEILEKRFDTRIVSIGTDFENESLRVGITNMELTDNQISELEKEIRNIVGDETNITLHKSGTVQLTSCSQTGNCHDIEGGVKITAENSTPCSVGYKATFQQKTGFITSGHCMQNTGTGEKVYQPNKIFWDEPVNRVGEVQKNTLAAVTSCDCAFVEESNSGMSVTDKAYSNKSISGTKNPVQYTWVHMEGHITKGKISGILDTYTVREAQFGSTVVTLYGLVETTEQVVGGDSGGIVYEEFGSGTPEFMGIITGNYPDENEVTRGYYTPVNLIQVNFNGITFG